MVSSANPRLLLESSTVKTRLTEQRPMELVYEDQPLDQQTPSQTYPSDPRPISSTSNISLPDRNKSVPLKRSFRRHNLSAESADISNQSLNGVRTADIDATLYNYNEENYRVNEYCVSDILKQYEQSQETRIKELQRALEELNTKNFRTMTEYYEQNLKTAISRWEKQLENRGQTLRYTYMKHSIINNNRLDFLSYSIIKCSPFI